MRYHIIGFYGRYFLLSIALHHLGNLTTGLMYTYETELPTCGEIADGPQELYKGQMNFTYYNTWEIKEVKTTDGDLETCDNPYSVYFQKPYLSVEFDKPVRINYVSLIYEPKKSNAWHPYLNANNTFPCEYACHDENYPLWTSLFRCGGTSSIELGLSWKARPPVICEIQIFTDKTCEHLPQLENGTYVISSAKNVSDYLYEIGTNATLQCSEGFQPSDLSSIPNTIQCEKSGQWSFTNVTCQKIACGHLPQLENGNYVISSVISSAGDESINYLYEIGTNATTQCSEGFQLSDFTTIPTTIQCETNGQWSFTNVTCQITCGYLPQLENGSYVASSDGRNVSDYLFEIGTNATLQCSEGFQPSDLSSILPTIQCETSGQWSSSNITCQRIPIAEEIYQYLQYVIPIAIVTLILIIIAINCIVLHHKKTSNKEKSQSEVITSVYNEDNEYDDPLYESVVPRATQPQHAFMLKSRDNSSNSRPRDSLYESLDARPDIIQHTTTTTANSDSCHEISPIYATPFCEKSTSSEFIINDLYASADQQVQNK